jgi:acyl-CoA dehydrogenase
MNSNGATRTKEAPRPNSKVSTSNITLGRNFLVDWEGAQPNNFYTADTNLQRSLEFHWGEEGYRRHLPRLYQFGRVAATEVNEAARISNLDANLPRLERFDGVGRRIEEVVFHPSYHEAGRGIYGSGMMSVYGEPGNNLLSLALFYISAQNGEAGHNCPAACTAGLIKALQNLASPELQDQYLPRLLDSNYDSHFHGAQFLTEVQGGSDVGANGTTASPLDPAAGTWLLNGEKWFCSNVTADLALVTARVAGQGEGTAGLGLFLLPRRLDDGTLNNVVIRRLKEKFGTRSMATAEIELHDAVAYQVGPLKNGFKNVMSYVVNTSRIYNAMGVTGNARRAYLTALTYAQHRQAFGRPIVHFPLVQDLLAKMRADVTAMLAGSLHIIALLDEMERGQRTAEAEGFLRLAINVNKYRTAVLAHEVIVQAIELLGGNGAIESFSILPRLLRDNVVYENWEGTHNVLLAQAQRDIRRYGVHEPFLAAVETMFHSLAYEELKAEGLAHLERIRSELDGLLTMDELTGSIFFRPLMDRLTDLYYAACMGVEGAWELMEKEDSSKQRLAVFFLNRRVAGRSPKDIPYYDDQISRLCAAGG